MNSPRAPSEICLFCSRASICAWLISLMKRWRKGRKASRCIARFFPLCVLVSIAMDQSSKSGFTNSGVRHSWVSRFFCSYFSHKEKKGDVIPLYTQCHDITKNTPFSDFFILLKGVSLASEIFLRATPSENLKYTPKSALAAGSPSIHPTDTEYKL